MPEEELDVRASAIHSDSEDSQGDWGIDAENEDEDPGPRRFSFFSDDEDGEPEAAMEQDVDTIAKLPKSTKQYEVIVKDEFSLQLDINRLDGNALINAKSSTKSQSRDVLELCVAALRPHFEHLLYRETDRVDVELLSFAKHRDHFRRALESLFNKRTRADGNRINLGKPDAPEYSKATMQVWSQYVQGIMLKYNPDSSVWLGKRITVITDAETYEVDVTVANRYMLMHRGGQQIPLRNGRRCEWHWEKPMLLR
jgi:hypothetical protein